MLLIGYGSWFFTRPAEPVYQGRTLSQWFDQIHDQVGTNKDPAVQAIRAMGKDAVPFLIQQLRLSNQVYRQTAIEYFNSYSGMKTYPNGWWHARASWCLHELGDQAASTAPDLIAIAKNTNAIYREDAIFLLEQVHAPPEITIPVLKDLLNDDNPQVLLSSANVLAQHGPGAQSAVPTLIQKWKELSAQIQSAQARGGAYPSMKIHERRIIGIDITKIDPAAAKKLGIEN